MGDFQQSLSTEHREQEHVQEGRVVSHVLRSAETAEQIANGERIRMMNGGIAAGAGSHCALLAACAQACATRNKTQDSQ